MSIHTYDKVEKIWNTTITFITILLLLYYNVIAITWFIGAVL